MRVGNLRHVITIQQRGDDTTDSSGGYVPVWESLHTGVRAAKSPLSGKEVLNASATQSVARVRWRFRHISGLDSTMRIVEDSTAYEIVEPPIDMGGRGKWIECLCKHVGGA